MRYFIDCEFIEDGKTIDLISIGVVSESGYEFYAQATWADFGKASDWVLANVYPSLRHADASGKRTCTASPMYIGNLKGACNGDDCPWRDREAMQANIRNFVDPDTYGKPELWGYYADYDWVALCQLFGTMMDLPKGWPMYCRDLKQWCDMVGNPTLPEQGKGEHNALADARWNVRAYEFLNEYARQRQMTRYV